MQKNILSFSLIALVFAFAACKKSNNTPANTAYVMFVHACAPGSTAINVDAYANNVAVQGATNMAFLKNSGYKPVTAGTNVNLAFNVTGLSQLTSASASLTANSYYTAYAGGSILQPNLVVTTDDLTPPTAGNAKVRFVNLCPDGLNTSCYFGATKLDSNIAFKAYTPFIEVAAGTGKLAMIDQTVLNNSAQITAQVLTAGKIYTAVLSGTTAAVTGASVLTLTVINNN